MAETFLILLAGGIMLAAVVSDPAQVTLLWLRLCGILALSMLALSVFFAMTTSRGATSPRVFVLFSATALAILAQLAFTQTARRRAQRICATLASILCVILGAIFIAPTTPRADVAWWQTYLVPAISALGIAAMSGLVLMDMLLGHAYLTASNMTMAPFRRLNLALGAALLIRAMTSIVGPLVVQRVVHVEMLWGIYGLYMLTRWLVGLGVPAVFVYMTHDCINRRATQSATGILYVAGVLVFIGEIIAVYLVRETGLPF
jgi:hypothetical protein